MKESIAALTSAEPCLHRNHGRSKADWPAVSAEGHGSQTAMEIEELNPWCFLTLGMIVLALALAAHLQSLTFLTLGVILLSHMRWRARIADGGGTRSSCSGTCGASHLR